MTLTEYAKKMRGFIEKAVQGLDTHDSLEAVSLYPKWSSGKNYTVGERIRYNEVLYLVLQPHLSQDSWAPDITPSLFARVLIPDENIIPKWEQPDSTNSYMAGDIVSHNGKTWTSNVDNNVWEPGVYGWSEVI